MRHPLFVLGALLLLAAPGHASELETPEQIRICVLRNTPDATHIQAVQLVSTDRVGRDRVARAHIYGRTDDAGGRRVLARFVEPEELLGSAFLFIETESGPQLVVRSPELGDVKRISGRQLSGSIAGSDFSYEDFQRMRALNRPGDPERLDDAEVEGRTVFVLESRPAAPEFSAYESVRHFVDKETCLVSRMELYERGHRLRKVLEASPERFRQVGSVWVAHEVVLRDVRDETRTRLLIESFDVDADVPASAFTIPALRAYKPEIGSRVPRPVAQPSDPEIRPEPPRF